MEETSSPAIDEPDICGFISEKHSAPHHSLDAKAKPLHPLLYTRFSHLNDLATRSNPEFVSSNEVDIERDANDHRPIQRSGTAPNGAGGFVGNPTASRPPLRDILLVPARKVASDSKISWKLSIINTVKASWLNVLLVFIPVSWAMHFSHVSDTLIFIVSFLAIIPLASLLGFATEQLALRVGDSLGSLLNATFGNSVELLISILALVKGELGIVRSSMLGSVISNTLLVLGMCFFAGGVRFHEQGYGMRAAQLNISLLGIAVVAFTVPMIFKASISGSFITEPEGELAASLLDISRGIAFLLLVTYAGYLTFQLYTHAYLFRTVTPFERRRIELEAGNDGPTPPGSVVFPRPSFLPSLGRSSSNASSRSSEDEEEVPKTKALYAVILLAVVTVLTGITAEWLLDSISGLTETGGISQEFVAFILLPLVGNAAEHVTAVVVSMKDKIDLAVGIAVGSSIQICLFVVPVLVLLGWAIGQPLTLVFPLFETGCLFLTILIVNWAIQDAKTNYMEGAILMMSYILISLTTWFYTIEG